MKITNKTNLPVALVNAVTFHDYNKGDSDYSVTHLLSPPRISILRKRHDAELEEDTADRIWALIGSTAHAILAKGSNGEIVEKRFFAEVAGKKISGQLDFGKDGTIYDYKLCSVWVAKDGAKPEWISQLNAYRYLAHKNGIELTALKIVAIYRDWSLNESKRSNEYPQAQVQVFDLPVWSFEITEQFIKDRIALHEAALTKLPECTDEERWAKDPSWAVIKKGNKRALRVHYSQTLAEAHLKSLDEKYEIVFRAGENIRCQNYCPVSQFCQQFKDIQSSQQAKPNTEEAF